MIPLLLVPLLALAEVTGPDLEGRKAWFHALIARSALEACKAAVPAQARTFEQATHRWLEANAELIERGEASYREEAGDQFQPEAFDYAGAHRQFAELLDGYPPERKLSWCREQLQMTPAGAD